ncbi:MAG: hypothetical protein ABMA64_28220 [Myxococcota bacterium]
MLGWWMAAAFARTPTLGGLVMTYTPDGTDPYVGAVEVKDAQTTTWVSGAERFGCVGSDGLVELSADPANWPLFPFPKKVVCYGADGRKVKIKVTVDASYLEPKVVGDGTLVLPRPKDRPVVYDGPVPHPDLVVQQGQTEGIPHECKVSVGGVVHVVIDGGAEDGDGTCTLATKYGEDVRLRLRLLTAK